MPPEVCFLSLTKPQVIERECGQAKTRDNRCKQLIYSHVSNKSLQKTKNTLLVVERFAVPSYDRRPSEQGWCDQASVKLRNWQPNNTPSWGCGMEHHMRRCTQRGDALAVHSGSRRNVQGESSRQTLGLLPRGCTRCVSTQHGGEMYFPEPIAAA